MATLNTTTAPNFISSLEASASAHCVRLDQVTTLLAAKAASAHTHTAVQVTDLEEAVEDIVGGMATDSGTLNLNYDDAFGTLAGEVRLKSGGALAADAAGIYADVGTGATQVAAGNHTHAELHAAVTVSNTPSINLTLDGQGLSAAAVVAEGGGLTLGDSGLEADVGTSAGQVAAGDHTHAQLHAAATVLDSYSVDLTLTGQQVQAALRRKSSGGLLEDSSGVYVDVGTASTQVAAGNHSHSSATASAAGFLSAADKVKLDALTVLQQVDQAVLFHRSDTVLVGEYVGGQSRWGQSMQALRVNVTADAPNTNTTLTLYVNGISTGQSVTIPSGAPGAEVTAAAELTETYIAAGEYARWLCTAGLNSGVADYAPGRIDVYMNVAPALAALPELRINCGGGAVSPYAEDGYYSGGSTGSTSTSITLTGVTDPAPEAVYQTARTSYYGDGAPLVYTLTGLGRGVDYLVRLHFAELSWTLEGDQVMDIEVAGLTTATTSNHDTLATAGAKYTAMVREYTLRADANGEIAVSLYPHQGASGGYHASINAIEVVEA